MSTGEETSQLVEHSPQPTGSRATCADWLSEGQFRVVEFVDLRDPVRYVGCEERRGRIVIEAPPGTAFFQ